MPKIHIFAQINIRYLDILGQNYYRFVGDSPVYFRYV